MRTIQSCPSLARNATCNRLSARWTVKGSDARGHLPIMSNGAKHHARAEARLRCRTRRRTICRCSSQNHHRVSPQSIAGKGKVATHHFLRASQHAVAKYFPGICTCPSHLFHPSQKPWNLASPPDTLSGMHKIIEIFADRAALHTEILALRQQIAVLKRKRPRPLLRKADRVFWVILSCLWPAWRHALVIVRPETVIGWHRKGFRLFWTRKSRREKLGRPPVSREIRYLVRRMSLENTRWGAPRIHGELLKLGFSISQAAVSKYMARYPSPPSQSWRTFLTNHADCLASIDFFVLPTATFHLLFGFIVLHHERRQIVHFGVTANPTMAWVAQQIRRGIPVGHGAAVPDPRPGRRIRAIVPLDRDGDGLGRGRHGATEPVAKSVCGTPDRQREARMPGPFDHPQRAAFAAHSWLIPRLLSRFKDPPVDRQGHTGWSTRSAGRVRNGRFLAQGRRSASSLRTPLGLTTPARVRSIPLCGDVDAADIRMPLHSFVGTIRRNKHRDDRAHG